jgi:hypothetical protein
VHGRGAWHAQKSSLTLFSAAVLPGRGAGNLPFGSFMTAKTITALIFALATAATSTGCSPRTVNDEPAGLNLEAILAHTSDFQRKILEDGLVTSAEFELALLARRDCVALAGEKPGQIYEAGDGERTFDFDVTAGTEQEMRNIQAKAEACLRDYFSDVGAVWAYQRLLTSE